LAHLAWIDPLFWDDPEIAAWLKQGKDFSLSDRQRITLNSAKSSAR
jgi:alpha-amylase/alpha-mannosidase (GH57 family)